MLGLDIGSHSVKAVELSGSLKSLSLSALNEARLPAHSIIDDQIMEFNDVSGVINQVCRGVGKSKESRSVVAGVGGNFVIVKPIVVPLMSDYELQESLEWHCEEHIPFEIKDVSLDYHVLQTTEDSIYLLVAACKLEHLTNVRQVIQLAGLNPAIIDVESFALNNCYEVNYEPDGGLCAALLNIGASHTSVNIVQGSYILYTRDINLGGNHYNQQLMRDLNMNFEAAESLKCGRQGPLVQRAANTDVVGVSVVAPTDSIDIAASLHPITEQIAREVEKTFDFYRATAGEEHVSGVSKIYLSGGCAKVEGLDGYLSQELRIPVELLDPLRRVKVDQRAFDPDLIDDSRPEIAVAVGLALRGVTG